MFNILFLDDMEWRHQQFGRVADHVPDVWVQKVFTASSAIALLDSEHFDQVFLDHDLSEEDIMMDVDAASTVATGMTVVDHILEMKRPPSQIVVHSCNTVAACRMADKLEAHPAGIWVRRIPFHELLNRMHQMISSR